MRAWLRETACCDRTTWQPLSRPRVMAASSRTCSMGFAALPASVRWVTVSRTLIARASDEGEGGVQRAGGAQEGGAQKVSWERYFSHVSISMGNSSTVPYLRKFLQAMVAASFFLASE